MSEVTPIVDDQEMLRAYAETIKLKDAEIERLKALLSRSADALERSNWVWNHGSELIAELRKAAQ
jgi:hypothetical protein